MSIETERLILRPFTESDAPALLTYLHTPAAHCFQDMKLSSLAEARAAALERSAHPDLTFAITRKDNGRVIGEIFSEPERIGPEQAIPDTYSPCWMLAPDAQGYGFMLEAARAYFDYLFTQKGTRRIYLYTEEDNLACQRLSEKLGMRKEGVFREFVTFVNDEKGDPLYETTLQYAILKKEWQS